MQKKTLVTGANGMLADALCPLLEKLGYKVYLIDVVGRDNIINLDIRNRKEIMDFIKDNKPDIIFHLAAETDVDKCEINKEHAYSTNAGGTENVSIACRALSDLSTKQGGYSYSPFFVRLDEFPLLFSTSYLKHHIRTPAQGADKNRGALHNSFV